MFGRQQQPEPTTQENPTQNVIGSLNQNYLSYKHDMQTVKSVHLTCDNKYVLFGALRKIFFYLVDDFQKIKTS